jgi:hypothetical protein
MVSVNPMAFLPTANARRRHNNISRMTHTFSERGDGLLRIQSTNIVTRLIENVPTFRNQLYRSIDAFNVPFWIAAIT